MDKIKTYVARADKELQKYPLLVRLEKQSGVSKVHLVGGAIAAVVVLLQFGSLATFIINILGLIIPAYMTLRLLSLADRTSGHGSSDTTTAAANNASIRNSLLYFVIFNALVLVEFYFPLGLSWVPLYPFLKLSLLAWMFLPRWNGATRVYELTVARVDDYLAEHGETASKINNVMASKIAKKMRSAIDEEVTNSAKATASASSEDSTKDD